MCKGILWVILYFQSLFLQVLRSIGYKTVPLDNDVPFEPKMGIIPNIAGKVIDSELTKSTSWL